MNQNGQNNQNRPNQNNQNGQNKANGANQNKEDRGQMNQSDRRFWTIVAAIVVIGGLVLLVMHRSANAPVSSDVSAMATTTASITASISTSTADTGVSDASSTESTYTYSCNDDKTIAATFHLPKDDFANVNLSDGRHLILAHAVSADGARYANANGDIVFWTKGVTAFVTENGTTTYSGCVANRFP